MAVPLRDIVTRIIVDALHDLGDDMFATSQRYVPVDRGTLKKSGVIRKDANGFEIAYRTPYARVIEFGYPAHNQNVRQHQVTGHMIKAHWRANARGFGKQLVGAHYQPPHSRGPFPRFMSERKGRYYLTRAFMDTMPRFRVYLARHLNSIGQTEVSL